MKYEKGDSAETVCDVRTPDRQTNNKTFYFKQDFHLLCTIQRKSDTRS